MLTLTGGPGGERRSGLCVQCNEILTINDVTEIESGSSVIAVELLLGCGLSILGKLFSCTFKY